MSNKQMRDKIRNITKAVENHEEIPERTKNIGLSIFFLFAGLGIFMIFSLSMIALFYKKYIISLITALIASGLGYLLYKIYTAQPLPED